MKDFSRQYLQSEPTWILNEKKKATKKISTQDLWEPCQWYWEKLTFRLQIEHN